MLELLPLRLRPLAPCVCLLTLAIAGPALGQRSIDGSANNSGGTTGDRLYRSSPAAYADGANAPSGPTRPGARAVSNALSAAGPSRPHPRLSELFWLWGQFIDHDLDLTEVDPEQSLPIGVPAGDAWFDPQGTGTQTIPFHRSKYDPTSGNSAVDPRQQTNRITAFLDASMVYGSDTLRAQALRALDGSGRLETSAGDLLPFNDSGLENANDGPLPDSSLFLAGDVRANENTALSAMHTLWMREHNRRADEIAGANPLMNGDEIYEAARAWVGALIQAITYREFLPLLLGDGALPAYAGHDPLANPAIATEFSTAAFRFGHTMLSERLERKNAALEEAPEGHLALRQAFFAPGELVDHGIDSLLRGLATSPAESIDPEVVDDVRNFLFGPPGAGGFDLAALNIQRGRDHGLGSYNEVRLALGLTPAAGFADVSQDAERQNQLASIYGDVDEIDLWVGGLCEDAAPTSELGPTFRTIAIDQFRRTRDADAFWYALHFGGATLAEIEATRLSAVVARNSGAQIQSEAFLVPEASGEAIATLALLVLAMRLSPMGKTLRTRNSPGPR